ncbi:MAG: GAF domain-containing SpoIIE family protein phosphatase [Melioribacteraceae bacterium]
MIKTSNNRKVENAIIVSVILFVFKIIFPQYNTTILLVINEVLVLLSFYFWIRYVSDFINLKISKLLSLVINAGILTALLFFIIAISSWLFSENTDASLIYILFSSLIAFVFIGALSYIFSVYKKLCFHRQKKSPSFYFNTMLVFFILTSLSASFFSPDKSVDGLKIILDSNNDFIYNALYMVTVSLIFMNSFRVAWIAFLNKKQKISLLVISIVLITLSWINVANENFTLINNFSPALDQLFNLVMVYGAIYFTIVFFIALFHLPTAGVIDRKSEELTSFKDLSKLMNQVFDVEELYETITSTALKVSNSDSSWLTINDKVSFDIHSAKGIGIVDAKSISDILFENNLVSSSETEIIDLSRIKKKYNTLQNFNSIVCAPLWVHNKNKGYLFTARKSTYEFEEEDSKSVGTFAGFAAVALENAQLLEESIEKERLEKELDVARDVQYKILPQKIPSYDNLEISALFTPAFEVGGDYYDFFNIDETKLGVVIADVSGKGIEAAFIMAEIKGIFSTLSILNLTTKELLGKVNLILKDNIDKKTFVTAVYGIVDIGKQTFTFSRAGHSPVYYTNNNSTKKLVPSGIGLGLNFTNQFENNLKEMEIKLNNNDIITLFTDGINESINEHLEEFGYDRLEKIISENANLSAEEISNKIITAVSLFSKDSSQRDDITLVILKWKN